MKKNYKFIVILIIGFVLAGCGYTTSSNLAGNFKTIYIAPFKNRINYATESRRKIYFPLLEVKARNAVIDRFLFNGVLRVEESDEADLTLKGELKSYERKTLRYTAANDAQEYRISIVVSLELWDNKKNELVWQELNFAGEATYFVTGSQAKSEETAVDEATVDLARRIVERTVENW